MHSESGSTISGWQLKASKPKGVVLLFHGIRANRIAMVERASFLFEASYSSILIDFQAHGESSGDRITVGYKEKYDVLAALAYAKTQYPNTPIAIIGVSMGGAAAILASPPGVSATILESVYPTIDSAIHNRVKAILGILSWLPAEILLAQLQPRLGIDREDLAPIHKISKLQSPIYIISGTQDKHTTKSDTLAIFQQAKPPKELWLVEGARHEDLLQYSQEVYKTNILNFLNKHLQTEQP